MLTLRHTFSIILYRFPLIGCKSEEGTTQNPIFYDSNILQVHGGNKFQGV